MRRRPLRLSVRLRAPPAAPARFRSRPILGAVIGLVAAACGHHEPPAPDASPSVALPELSAPGAMASGNDAAAAAPPLTPAFDSASLPQTPEVARADGPAFEARRDALWQAIVTDDAERAMPFFFPLGAYQQVKDVANPAADWRHRLVSAYQHDIHALHARLGPTPGDAKFLGLDVPEGRARWIEPGRGVQQDRLLPRLRVEAAVLARRRSAHLRREVAHLVARRVVRRSPQRDRMTPSHLRGGPAAAPLPRVHVATGLRHVKSCWSAPPSSGELGKRPR